MDEDSFRRAQRSDYAVIGKVDHRVLCREITIVCCENYTELTHLINCVGRILEFWW